MGIQASCCIATDCKPLYDEICKSKANLRQVDGTSKYFLLLNGMLNIKVLLINRSQNSKAHKLDKNGAARINMLAGWSQHSFQLKAPTCEHLREVMLFPHIQNTHLIFICKNRYTLAAITQGRYSILNLPSVPLLNLNTL